MSHRMLASICLVAGVFVMFGPGPALLAAGVLLWVRDERAERWLVARRNQVVTQARSIGAKLTRVPRRSLAGLSMAAGLVATPAGVAVAFGLGAAVVTAGVTLIGFSLLTGWGA